MKFLDFVEKFPTQRAIITHYIGIRYKNGVCCNHCNSPKVYQKNDRPKVFHCDGCKNTFSIFKGTIFEKTRVDLRKWFYALHLFLNAKKGISGLQLQREIGGGYECAWRMLKQIRTAMGNDNDMTLYFDTVVEIDETYVGGKPRRRGKFKSDTGEVLPFVKSKRGRGTHKTPVVGIIDRVNKKAHARVALPNEDGKSLTGKQLLTILTQVTKAGATVMTDQFRAYRILSKNGFTHLQVDHTKEYVNGNVHTNGIESFWATLKRAMYGVYHSVSVKYLQRYVDEFCFRYNNRRNPDIFDLVLEKSLLPLGL